MLDVDVSNNRISLGMKQLEDNPYEQLTSKYPPGTIVKGQVRNIADLVFSWKSKRALTVSFTSAICLGLNG